MNKKEKDQPADIEGEITIGKWTPEMEAKVKEICKRKRWWKRNK